MADEKTGGGGGDAGYHGGGFGALPAREHVCWEMVEGVISKI